MNRRIVRASAALGVAALLAAGCGDADEPITTTTAAAPAADDGAEPSGGGRAVEGSVLDEPPAATGDVVTAEQADGVSRSVIVAWMRGDRATAEVFVPSPDVLDDLFAVTVPSNQLEDEDEDDDAFCSKDDGGSFTGCSYTLVDDSDDGILAVATEVRIVDGVVLVVSAGAADWND